MQAARPAQLAQSERFRKKLSDEGVSGMRLVVSWRR
jgi:hypothetical protein